MWVTGTGTTIVNNLVYDNDRSNKGHWNIGIADYDNLVENNTLYGGNGLYWDGPWGDVTRNNIIWAKGAGHYAIYYERTDGTPFSDFNNFYASDGATLGYWGGAPHQPRRVAVGHRPRHQQPQHRSALRGRERRGRHARRFLRRGRRLPSRLHRRLVSRRFLVCRRHQLALH